MTVYIFGFPFGGKLALGKGNPPVTVGRGQVSSVRRGEDDRLTSVLLDGALNPGNSGGPVVDARGKLVGVARATIRGANIGFAIAVPEVLAMLDGKAEGPTFAVGPTGAEARVEVPLIDPLGRIKSARLLTARGTPKYAQTRRRKPARGPAGIGDEDEEAPRPRAGRDDETETIFGPLEGAESLPLTLGGPRAAGVVKLPPAGEDVALWCQVALVDGSGKAVHAKPARWLLGAGRPGGPTLWGEVVDPDGDCGLKPEGGGLAFEVPGTLHDLNIDIGKTNAPRVVQEVEGDFSAQVKVSGSFRPGPDRTGPKSVPYNDGGILVWQDSDNYIFLGRAGINRGGKTAEFAAFEEREWGTRGALNNRGIDPGGVYLRLERRNNRILGYTSKDGRDWARLEPMETSYPATLKVGLYAINGCADPITVRFEDFSFAEGRSGAKPKAKAR